MRSNSKVILESLFDIMQLNASCNTKYTLNMIALARIVNDVNMA